jgi:hypothetical protein
LPVGVELICIIHFFRKIIKENKKKILNFMNIPLHNKEGHVCERITTEAGFTKNPKNSKVYKSIGKEVKKLHSGLVLCLQYYSLTFPNRVSWCINILHAWISHTGLKVGETAEFTQKN